MKRDLVWKEEENREVFRCRVFSIRECTCRSPEDERRKYTVMDAANWAIIVPVLETPRGREFVMVRQWRHGSRELSLEFPGGVFEPGEDPAAAATRELREETAYRPGRIEKIGEFNPNPAIMSNRVYFFLAEDLQETGVQDLDDDEYIEVERIAVEKVFHGMGRAPYIHALMGTALALYLKKTAGDPDSLRQIIGGS
ncbi:MAG: NUDIX hydrolase [Treponema sp.]|jgi:8-oxo-dGTP pyrophosphatase MutT (NUDIX family)|nr:NUDIX hydrolase [Treponema sp.]